MIAERSRAEARRRLIMTASSVASIIASATTLKGQAQVSVLDEITCSDCQIAMRTLVVSDRGTDGSFGPLGSFSTDRYGNLYVVSSVETYRVLMFDSAGLFLRSWGRDGNGPGEYHLATPPLRTAADSLFIFDISTRRLTVLSPEFKVVRTVNLQFAPRGVIALDDGGLLVNADIRTRERAGYPLHFATPDGIVTKSFGVGTANYRFDLPMENRRRLAADGAGSVWTARANQYLLERWDSGGSLAAQVRLDADWFPHWARPETRLDSVPPVPAIVKIWVENENLWVVTHIADSNWRPQANVPAAAEARRYDGTTYHRIWDTRIDVINMRSWKLLTTTTFDGYLIPGFAGHILAEYAEGQDASPLFRIHRPTLVQPTHGGTR